MRKILLSFLFTVSAATSIFATAQAPDILIYQGNTYKLYSNPLETFYGKGERPRFWVKPNISSTGNWRGYVATWEITDDQLYLKRINSWFCGAEIKTENNCREVTLRDVFGAKVFDGKVAATWVSDELRVPDGKPVQIINMGYGSIYERDILLSVSEGKITNRKVIDNTKQALPAIREVQEKELEKLKNSPLGNQPATPVKKDNKL